MGVWNTKIVTAWAQQVGQKGCFLQGPFMMIEKIPWGGKNYMEPGIENFQSRELQGKNGIICGSNPLSILEHTLTKVAEYLPLKSFFEYSHALFHKVFLTKTVFHDLSSPLQLCKSLKIYQELIKERNLPREKWGVIFQSDKKWFAI